MAWWSLWREKPARVLAGNHQIFDGRLVLTDDALYVPSEGKEIPYGAISAVRADKFNDDLTIYEGGRDLSELPNSSTTLNFKNAAVRDIALASLERHLVPRLQRREVQWGTVHAALAPFLMGVLIAMLTYGSMQIPALFAAGDEVFYVNKGGGRWRTEALGFIRVCKALGATGVAIVGGLAVAGCIVWLVARVKRPPLIITLSPSK